MSFTDFDVYSPRARQVQPTPPPQPEPPGGGDLADFDVYDRRPAAEKLPQYGPFLPKDYSPPIDWGDIGKGAVGGLGRGVTGLAGLPGTIREGARAAASFGASKLGIPQEYVGLAGQALRNTPLGVMFGNAPSGSDIQHGVEQYTGKFYEPTTGAGRLASNVGEFAPSALAPGTAAAKAFNVLVPSIISHTAGEITKDTAAEPWARAVGGIVGGVAAAKLATPTAPPTAAWRQATNELTAAGVPLPAGDRTGSRALRWFESNAADNPFASRAARELYEKRDTAYDRALTDRTFPRSALGPDENLPQALRVPPGSPPGTKSPGEKALNDKYDEIFMAHDLPWEDRMWNELHAPIRKYANSGFASQDKPGLKNLEAITKDIADEFLFHPGATISGQKYKQFTSDLGDLAAATLYDTGGNRPDKALGAAYTALKKALDDAYRRNLPPNVAADLALNDRRYAVMKALEPAAAAAGEHMSPAQVESALKRGRVGQYARQTGTADALADAAALVMKPLPQSGTGPRTAAQQLFSIPTALHTGGGAATGGVLGSLLGIPWLGAAVGAAAPHVAARVAVSRPGQWYLGNQAIPQQGRDVMAQTMLEQAISQPAGLERNETAQQAMERRIDEQRHRMGLPSLLGRAPLRINLQQGAPPL
jgi:hypothetical protein